MTIHIVKINDYSTVHDPAGIMIQGFRMFCLDI